MIEKIETTKITMICIDENIRENKREWIMNQYIFVKLVTFMRHETKNSEKS